MVLAILIADNKIYKVNQRKLSPSIRSSFTWTGERWPVTINKVSRSLTYSDSFGAVFQLILPDDPDNPIIWELLETDNLKVYHDNNKCRFNTPPGKNCYYVRLVFSHPKFLNKVQVIFRYNLEMTPINLGNAFFNGGETISFIPYKM